MHTKRRPPRHGFTLIELLIVILIVGILMAVAMPNYLAVVSDAQLKVCRTNMETIVIAEASYRTANPAHKFTTFLDLLDPDLGATPECPDGGKYSVSISNGKGRANNGKIVPAGTIIVHCSAGHGVFAPGIDGQ